MKNHLLLLLFVFFSCNSVENKLEEISVNLQNSKTGYLDEIADSLIITNLPDNFFTGEITMAKCYDSLIFFHDFYNQIIHIYDVKSENYCKLSKKGRAGDEYGSIESFSFNKWKSEILVYDSKARKIIIYSYPNMKAINKWDENRSFMNVEYINKDEIIMFSDDIENTIFFRNIETKKERLVDFDILTSSMGLSYPQTISFSKDNILYSKPYEYSNVYSINSKGDFSVIYKISFGANAFPEKYWKSKDPIEFQENIINNDYAIMPQYLINGNDKFSFWFLTSTKNELNLAIYDKKNKNVKLYNELRIKGLNEPLKPLGIFDEFFISILYPETLTIDRKLNDSLAVKIINNIDCATTTPILILYKMN